MKRLWRQSAHRAAPCSLRRSTGHVVFPAVHGRCTELPGDLRRGSDPRLRRHHAMQPRLSAGWQTPAKPTVRLSPAALAAGQSSRNTHTVRVCSAEPPKATALARLRFSAHQLRLRERLPPRAATLAPAAPVREYSAHTPRPLSLLRVLDTPSTSTPQGTASHTDLSPHALLTLVADRA